MRSAGGTLRCCWCGEEGGLLPPAHVLLCYCSSQPPGSLHLTLHPPPRPSPPLPGLVLDLAELLYDQAQARHLVATPVHLVAFSDEEGVR